MSPIHDQIGPELGTKLLGQPFRTHDRDYHEGWQGYENFSEYYEQFKHLFIVGFSDPDRLVQRVVRMYLMAQVRGLSTATKEASHEQLDAFFEGYVAQHWSKLLAVLEEKWPRELADLRAVSERPG